MMAARRQPDLTAETHLQAAHETVSRWVRVLTPLAPEQLVPEQGGAPITEALAAVLQQTALALTAVLADTPGVPKAESVERCGIALNLAREMLYTWRRQELPVVTSRILARLESLQTALSNATWAL